MIPLLIVLLSWIAIEIDIAGAINAVEIQRQRRPLTTCCLVHRATTVSTKLLARNWTLGVHPGKKKTRRFPDGLLASVVSNMPATEAAYCCARRMSLAGSGMPASIMSPYSTNGRQQGLRNTLRFVYAKRRS
jgi:hypothetical protein